MVAAKSDESAVSIYVALMEFNPCKTQGKSAGKFQSKSLMRIMKVTIMEFGLYSAIPIRNALRHDW